MEYKSYETYTDMSIGYPDYSLEEDLTKFINLSDKNVEYDEDEQLDLEDIEDGDYTDIKTYSPKDLDVKKVEPKKILPNCQIYKPIAMFNGGLEDSTLRRESIINSLFNNDFDMPEGILYQVDGIKEYVFKSHDDIMNYIIHYCKKQNDKYYITLYLETFNVKIYGTVKFIFDMIIKKYTY